MKGKLLLGMLLATIGLSAQETHHINWFMGVNNAQASLTILEGDTVEWTWTDALPHTVTSNAGGTDTFDSGTITGNGQTFSHLFENEGATTYKCDVHPMMQGTITVTALAGTKDNVIEGFDFYPNPATDVLTINANDIIERIEIYDATGRQVMNSKSGNLTSKVYMSNYAPGTYYVRAYTASASKNITIVKN
jgi:hypothetical protein